MKNFWNWLLGLLPFGKKTASPSPAVPAPAAPQAPAPVSSAPVAAPVAAPPATKPAPVPSGPWVVPSFAIRSPRRLDADLEKQIDATLMKIHPDLLRKACDTKDGNLATWLAGEALTAMKVREKTNQNDGVLVEKIQWTTHGSRGDAWCMDQQQTQVAYAEKKISKVSKLPMSASCAAVRAQVLKSLVIATLQGGKVVGIENCQPGDLWVWLHSDGSGHAGGFSQWKNKYSVANLNEGNTTQGTAGSAIVREGGGSYLTERTVTTSGDMVLKMVIRAF